MSVAMKKEELRLFFFFGCSFWIFLLLYGLVLPATGLMGESLCSQKSFQSTALFRRNCHCIDPAWALLLFPLPVQCLLYQIAADAATPGNITYSNKTELSVASDRNTDHTFIEGRQVPVAEQQRLVNGQMGCSKQGFQALQPLGCYFMTVMYS
jgi:hypothetical protein